jgi:hypothetical protein
MRATDPFIVNDIAPFREVGMARLNTRQSMT